MTNKLLAALEAATEADLEEIDGQIAKLQKQLDSLKSARTLIDVALHGVKPRSPRGTGKFALKKAAAAARTTSEPPPVASHDDESDDLGDRMRELLEDEGGMSVAAIAARLKVTASQVYYHAKRGPFALVAGELRIKR